MAVRIGIDVGGTFTDAVILDNDTFELIGTVKVPTTHESEQGVAEGIVKALKKALEEYNISPEDVTFIAHGTTQATNALLEGDVEKVGIVGVGRGVEGYKVKLDTEIGKIELAPNKFLCTKHYFLTQDNNLQKNLNDYIADMISENIGVAVVSAAYSVDDPTSEIEVMDSIAEAGLLGTCSHEISKLYGLRIRTRTAVINASILPKMIQTANMTEKSVIDSNISAPLMIMRCDGGVMSVKEISKRPILTMLSGPAAGVAGALMSEKVS
ncbi:MAG: hydantoinase/oxoprolinase family protein, partial [Clostridiaceae bacterium]|nr:hydantoinase/oxoprolinase family protein [Clostridiaceae bacterium]